MRQIRIEHISNIFRTYFEHISINSREVSKSLNSSLARFNMFDIGISPTDVYRDATCDAAISHARDSDTELFHVEASLDIFLE